MVLSAPQHRAAHAARRTAALLTLPLLLCALPGAGQAADRDRAQWDRRYSGAGYVYGDEPAPTLKAWRALLAARATGGRALDVACGESQNGVYLAQLGYRVDAVDISRVALAKARQLAARKGVAARLKTIRADLERESLPAGGYDAIVNFRFLLRRLAPQMIAALKPGGVLIFESFTVDDPVARRAERSHFLQRNELLRLYDKLQVLYYHERRQGQRAVATLVARKPGASDPLQHGDPFGR